MFFTGGQHVFFRENPNVAPVQVATGYFAYESAEEYAKFMNWLHELYTRERQGSPEKSPGDCPDGPCCELDGRCG